MANSYTVRSGDTLGKIASRLGTTVEALARANGIQDVNRISVGQILKVPGGAAPSPPPPAPRATPRATGRHVLGALSAKYETGNRGPGTVSGGHGDPGGVSYGSYQLASTRGTPQQFLAKEGAGWAGEFGSAAPGTPPFTAAWKAIAQREPALFHEAQHEFIKRTHYDPQIARVRAKTGVDIEERSDAVRDAVWSTAVQHGAATNAVVNAIGTGAADDRALLEALYKERGKRRADGKLAYFPSARADVQAGVARRFRDELEDALKMLAAPASGPAPAAGQPAAAAPLTGEDWPMMIATYGDEEARADFDAGKRVVIALRKPTSTKANQGRGIYDDRMIVVSRTGGALQVIEFTGNTEPSRQYGWDGRKPTGADRNRDGKVDQGRLRAGTYRYERQAASFLGAPYFKSKGVQASERDINQDGLFTVEDGDRIDPSGAGRSMHVHRGGDDNTWSAGCQTIPKSRYDAFLRSLGDQRAFCYILIDRES